MCLCAFTTWLTPSSLALCVGAFAFVDFVCLVSSFLKWWFTLIPLCLSSLSLSLCKDNQHFMAIANSNASLLFSSACLPLSLCLSVSPFVCLRVFYDHSLFFDFAIIYCSAPLLVLCATQFDITWGGLLSGYLPLQFIKRATSTLALLRSPTHWWSTKFAQFWPRPSQSLTLTNILPAALHLGWVVCLVLACALPLSVDPRNSLNFDLDLVSHSHIHIHAHFAQVVSLLQCTLSHSLLVLHIHSQKNDRQRAR